MPRDTRRRGQHLALIVSFDGSYHAPSRACWGHTVSIFSPGWVQSERLMDRCQHVLAVDAFEAKSAGLWALWADLRTVLAALSGVCTEVSSTNRYIGMFGVMMSVVRGWYRDPLAPFGKGDASG